MYFLDKRNGYFVVVVVHIMERRENGIVDGGGWVK